MRTIYEYAERKGIFADYENGTARVVVNGGTAEVLGTVLAVIDAAAQSLSQLTGADKDDMLASIIAGATEDNGYIEQTDVQMISEGDDDESGNETRN